MATGRLVYGVAPTLTAKKKAEKAAVVKKVTAPDPGGFEPEED